MAPELTTDDGTAPEPPQFNPGRFDVPAYGDIESDEDLIAYSRAYLALAISHYDLEVDASHIAEWSVSHRAKRRAAGVRTPDLSKLGVFTAAGLTAPDWDALREDHNETIQRSSVPLDDVKDVEVTLTWDAFEAYGEAEWQETLRHEAIHIEQYHQHGESGHGLDFRTRADELATTENCKQFTDYEYEFECPDCEEPRGGRYRESKAVEFARLSREEQEEWVEDGKSSWECEDCGAYVSLRE